MNGTIIFRHGMSKIYGTITLLFLLAILPLVASADSTIIAGESGSNKITIHHSVWTNRTTAYVFSATATNSLQYVKSTDGGASWSGVVSIDDTTPPAGYRINGFDVWYARWSSVGVTPYIHITWRYFTTGSPQAHLSYNRLDTTTDTLLNACSPTHTVCDILSSNSDNVSATCIWSARCVSIVRELNGNLYIKNMQTTGFLRSTDSGATWASRTNTTDSPPWIMSPASVNNAILVVGGTTASYKIQWYDNLTNAWAVLSTITPARNPAYDFKGWDIVAAPQSAYAGFSDGTTFRIFEVVWNGTSFDVTEQTAVSGFTANTNDIDLAYDETNGRLYAFYNNGSGIRYQRTNESLATTGTSITWASAQTVTTTNVVAVRVPPNFPVDANRLMPTFFVNPDWTRNLNALILVEIVEPEDIDNWLIHFIDLFQMSDATGRTIAAGGLLGAVMFGLFIMRVWYMIAAVISVMFAAGLSQVRIMDDSRLIDPWIILVPLLLGGVAVIVKVIMLKKAGN